MGIWGVIIQSNPALIFNASGQGDSRWSEKAVFTTFVKLIHDVRFFGFVWGFFVCVVNCKKMEEGKGNKAFFKYISPRARERRIQLFYLMG